MGQTMLPLEVPIKTNPATIAPAKKCAVIPCVFGRQTFLTARLACSKMKKNPKTYSYRLSFLQITPAGKVLLGTVVLLNIIYTSYAFPTFALRDFQADIAAEINRQMQHFMICNN